MLILSGTEDLSLPSDSQGAPVLEAQKLQNAILIDDDEVDLLLHKRVIKRSGLFEVVRSFQYAEDALEFLREADREEIDVIFLDVNMPRMSGLEFLARFAVELGANSDKIVIVMLTTSLNCRDREEAENYGMVKAFFNKPLTLDQLQSVAEISGSLC